MRIHTDPFETVLPKERFFTPPPKPETAPRRPVWSFVICGGILLAAILTVTRPQPMAAPAAPSREVQAPSAAGSRPLPDPSPVPRAMPVAVTTAPRAQLLHIRPIGVFENDTMPDGRVLGTTYRGELADVANLPKFGQLGDMWYTRRDGHCWVLAPIYAGSQATGWVDP
jgi:hypothetical protein